MLNLYNYDLPPSETHAVLENLKQFLTNGLNSDNEEVRNLYVPYLSYDNKVYIAAAALVWYFSFDLIN